MDIFYEADYLAFGGKLKAEHELRLKFFAENTYFLLRKYNIVLLNSNFSNEGSPSSQFWGVGSLVLNYI